MGTKLLASPQIKDLIETLIENGSFTEDLQKSWEKKSKQKKDMEALLKKAEEGDVESMWEVYKEYRYGFEKNNALALHWLERYALKKLYGKERPHGT